MVNWDDPFVNVQWQLHSFLSMIYGAWNERRILCNQSTVSIPAIGDIIQTASRWATIQQWIEDNCSRFMKIDNTVWEGNQDPPTRWTFSTLASEVLPSGVSWTRKYPREFLSDSSTAYTDGTAFVEGHKARKRRTGTAADGRIFLRQGGQWILSSSLQPDIIETTGRINANTGDYFGDWIFDEIRNCLKKLKWLVCSPSPSSTTIGTGVSGVTCTWTSKGELNGNWGSTTPFEPQSDWEDAKTFTENVFNSSPNSYNGTSPLAYTNANQNLGVFSAQMFRRYAYLRIAGLTTQYSCSIDYYSYANKWAFEDGTGFGTSIWNSNGDDVTENVYHSWDSSPPNNIGTRDSIKLGGTGMPVWCDQPADTGATGSKHKGHFVRPGRGISHNSSGSEQRAGKDPFAVLKFDVVGGLQYP